MGSETSSEDGDKVVFRALAGGALRRNAFTVSATWPQLRITACRAGLAVDAQVLGARWSSRWEDLERAQVGYRGIVFQSRVGPGARVVFLTPRPRKRLSTILAEFGVPIERVRIVLFKDF